MFSLTKRGTSSHQFALDSCRLTEGFLMGMFPLEEKFGKEIVSWSSHREDIGPIWFWWYYPMITLCITNSGINVHLKTYKVVNKLCLQYLLSMFL